MLRCYVMLHAHKEAEKEKECFIDISVYKMNNTK